ncbi:HEPN domain-containing protein [Namhaeicola litoreus]|uniref:HEPN domain-containing protein n=1 Tax=Namhaeicola litoreus TaxID=1052145 RepID=A0ABW3Y2A1_9FLAO
MQSFRTEIENPIVQKDIIDLEKKIRLFKEGKIDEERFRSLRLARGVYGQRQEGVQMIRIKLPFGKLTAEQLKRICDVSEEYSTGRLHITTRQDIQIHYVSLDRTPELWAELEKDEITLREACGNTVRNITASETAGINPEEPFDVSPYADAMFRFFLRNPICQEMGRKFKISFSATEADDALSYMHDLGFIAKTKWIDNKEVRGFKVLIGGGLGSQSRHGDLAHEFLQEDQIIPFTEGVLRIFDRYGERAKRAKARLKFLLEEIGVRKFLDFVKEEQKALAYQSYPIDLSSYDNTVRLKDVLVPKIDLDRFPEYETWLKTNAFKQKQEGLFAIGIKVQLGDFYLDQARKLADLVKTYAGNEIRLSLKQNILIRHVRKEFLPFFYSELNQLGFTDLGYNSTLDITACPGTDTCNLGIASSTGISRVLENVIKTEYPQYIYNSDITIKISGCMNSCGQHSMAQIGFHGMSIKSGNLVAPGLQVLLGGGTVGNGLGRLSEKIIKIPSKRGPQALRGLLNDYELNKFSSELFNDYFDRQGKNYFYQLLKPLSNSDDLVQDDFIDWGHENTYVKAIGVGECAGVVIDLVATLLFESEEKLDNAVQAIENKKYADGIYHAYASMINTAKAVLIGENFKTNTHKGIIDEFDTAFVQSGLIKMHKSFKELVYQINQNQPNQTFAQNYLNEAKDFYQKIDELRAISIANG